MSYYFLDSQLRNWAYHPEQFVGMGQDFDLFVAGLHNADIILECASDNLCPKQLFFLNCACLIIGDSVRLHADGSAFVDQEREVLTFVRRAEKTGNAYLLEFVWRARDLIENPSTFEYDLWCGGELASSLYLA